ncbi:hypothetical protein AB6F11_14750 [Vibrio sp. 10N.247.311.14]|uniref:hypothetical protein n=1 Tax=unclassified Vibrio TaxID=2614977 RepID=UPI000CBCC4F1|nr:MULTISPECIES: hypothetical protein [unclassified Vibrio]PMK18016.1 hypothetical protein BCU05_18330 [Vibrio sp. 10N.261.54.C3]TKF43868.1 hypothetical protein FCV57_05170 [Vibrio sp. F13]TKF62460.1 hypothetical protein FCV58_19030 [Vibrio sp. F13]
MPKIVITPETLPTILDVINTWEGKLTWPLLCERVADLLGIKGGVQRQSLSSYKQIQEAYTDKKDALRHPVAPDAAPTVKVDVDYLQGKVRALEAEVARLTVLNNAYKQRFILWQHNAYKNGVRMESLDDAIEMLQKPLVELKRKTGGQ